jgi:predicted N-acyltransferase
MHTSPSTIERPPVKRHIARSGKSEYTYSLHASIHDITPADWARACGTTDNLFLDRRFITAVESSLSDAGSRLSHVIFRDDTGAPVACASLCLYPVDLSVLAGERIKRWVLRLRRVFPAFGFVRVLFCGLPVSIGQSSLGFADGCDAAAVIALLESVMRGVARREKARMFVFKEFTQRECAYMDALSAAGYIRAETPCMHVFESRFRNLEHYCAALRSHYRNDIKRSARKFATAELTISRVQNGDRVAREYTDECHRLYEAVVAKAEHKLELLPAAFFRDIARQFPDDVSLTMIRDGERVIAFNYSLRANKSYYFLFCGMDYSYQGSADVYFNLMCEDLGHGMGDGVELIQLGQTSEQFKARLGCSTYPLFFYANARGLLGVLLRRCAKLLFPPRPVPVTYNVFKT